MSFEGDHKLWVDKDMRGGSCCLLQEAVVAIVLLHSFLLKPT
jgi:hypothetical protein